MNVRSNSPLLLIGLAIASACAPAVPPSPGPPSVPEGLPPIPRVEGPLGIRIVHPPAGTARPNVDSVFVYGSVGTGHAELTVNGFDVPVEPNGAFLGFLPRPVNDTLHLVAKANGEVAEGTTWYRPPAQPSGTVTPVMTVDYDTPRVATVVGRDTLATGSDVTIGRPTPTGTYRWFLPRGARLRLTGERGSMVRAQLDSQTVAWFPRAEVTETDTIGAADSIEGWSLVLSDEWSDLRIRAPWAPFRIEAGPSRLEITLHGVSAAATIGEETDHVVRSVTIVPNGPDVAQLSVETVGPVWGYKSFYEDDGTLVIRIRRPPDIDSSAPLRGIRIVVDPGHPPGGAIGPTGLVEADANLGIGLRLAEQLRVRGAEVWITRTTPDPLGLAERVEFAVDRDADLLISVHNNAFAEGANPFRRNGTSTYYFHPFSAALARSLNDEIVAVTRIQDLGALSGNLALVRPTWMPSVLTESLFMPIPAQESALRNSLFLERLAAAHVAGLERFLSSVVSGSGAEATDATIIGAGGGW